MVEILFLLVMVRRRFGAESQILRNLKESWGSRSTPVVSRREDIDFVTKHNKKLTLELKATDLREDAMEPIYTSELRTGAALARSEPAE